ncbi:MULTISPECIES: glycoside hydrolase family 15 [unclassified Actinomyces]|uniref:glycoside hydrolase family 15 n=1 Tax=unclassified Actinomyces TaxID=2609248 RepID=UPI0011BF154C|nr:MULTISPECIES: glycoside hydrolase family 15 [unclassified Actinomyces]
MMRAEGGGAGRLPRRALLLAVPAAVAAASATVLLSSRPARPALLSGGVLARTDGVVTVLPPERTGRPTPLAAAVRQGLDAATLPTGRWEEFARTALIDLLTLTGPALAEPGAAAAGAVTRFPHGAVVAGPVSIWRYIWPRDAAFAAAAYAAVGLEAQALDVLAQLATLQRRDGGFEARYTAVGVVPDDRPAQSDGTGWFLWAIGRLLAAGARVDELSARLGEASARACGFLLDLTDTPAHLPAAAPDYWEVGERTLTLGTAAPTLLGLEAAAALAQAGLELGAGAGPLTERTVTVRAAMERGFAPGWGRHVRGDDLDAAIALVAPPFTRALDGVAAVRDGAVARMSRPAGGVAPGESWRDDGISWTPETALLAWSAAGLGRDAEARTLLEWLEAHRTRAGALPEKVRADGLPAGPAPLAWTCALVLLATAELRRDR